MRIRPALWALVVALATIGGLLAHAAGAHLASEQLGAYSYTHPCPVVATVTATGSAASSVTVTTDPTCAGQQVAVTVLGTGGTTLSTGTAALTGATTVVPVTTFTTAAVTQVRASIAGWAIAALWNAPPSGPVTPTNPDTPNQPGTFMASITWTLVTNNPVQACFDVNVTTSSTTPVTWSLDVNLTKAPFNGVDAKRFTLTGTDGWRYQTTAAAPGLMRITGKASAGTATVVAGQHYTVGVCHYQLPDPVQTPGAYTVTHTPTTWTDTRACVATTVTGNGTEPFYFAWTTPVDMTAAAARLTGAGRRVDAYTYGDTEWMVTRTRPGGGTVFQVTSKSPASLHDRTSFTFTTCAVSYH